MKIKKRYFVAIALIALFTIPFLAPRSPYQGTWFNVATESKGPWSISIFSNWFKIQHANPAGPFGDKSGGIAYDIQSSSTKDGVTTIEGMSKREIAGFYIPRTLLFKIDKGVLVLLENDLSEIARYKLYDK